MLLIYYNVYVVDDREKFFQINYERITPPPLYEYFVNSHYKWFSHTCFEAGGRSEIMLFNWIKKKIASVRKKQSIKLKLDGKEIASHVARCLTNHDKD